jgi:tellurite resistance-related uncharacterized protein
MTIGRLAVVIDRLRDNTHYEPFFAPPAIFKKYTTEDGQYWILYYLEGDTLVIANIGDRTEQPHLWR